MKTDEIRGARLLAICRTEDEAEHCAGILRRRGYDWPLQVRRSPGRFGSWGLYAYHDGRAINHEGD